MDLDDFLGLTVIVLLLAIAFALGVLVGSHIDCHDSQDYNVTKTNKTNNVMIVPTTQTRPTRTSSNVRPVR